MTARLILTLALAALAACDLPPAMHGLAQSEGGDRPARAEVLDRPVYHGNGQWTQVGPDGPGISSGEVRP